MSLATMWAIEQGARTTRTLAALNRYAPAPVTRSAPLAPVRTSPTILTKSVPSLDVAGLLNAYNVLQVAKQDGHYDYFTSRAQTAARGDVEAEIRAYAASKGNDVSLLSKIAKGALNVVAGAIPGGNIIKAGASALGGLIGGSRPRTLPTPPGMPQLPALSGIRPGGTMVQSFAPASFAPAVARGAVAVGRAAVRSKWVRHVVGGVVTWLLVDAAGNVLRQSDRAPTRRMNPMNVKALRRADRRICSFAGISRGVLRDLGYRVESTRRPKHKITGRKKRRCA